MGIEKKPLKKKVLDQLKNEIQPADRNENDQLTGGFLGTTEPDLPGLPGNLNTNCPCNTVTGCGATVAQSL